MSTTHQPDAPASLCTAFQETARAYGGAVALRTSGGAASWTWSEVAAQVRDAAARLTTLGVRPGDTVGLMLANRPEFHVLDLAALHLGATPFSIYATSPAVQVGAILRNAAPRVVLADEAHVQTVIDAARHAELDEDPSIVTVGPGRPILGDVPPAAPFDFEATWRAVPADALAVLIYTSGTTGAPKGVQLTHRSLIAAFDAAVAAVPAVGRRGRVVSYLPHAHIADRFFSHYQAIFTGSSITCVEDGRAIVTALPDAHPTIWLAVPRIWEKLKVSLERNVPPDAGPAIHAAVRGMLGLDGAEVLLSGAAPIAKEVLEYFASLGMEVLEGYGMSECSAVIGSNRPGAARPGTVGLPAPGVELRLACDGEILVRGPMVMTGYRADPDQTAATIDPDGWLHTGDVGVIDEAGALRIVDRKKELIINASGKNMSPASIERAIKVQSSLIAEAVAIGDRRPYVTALLVLDPDAAPDDPDAEQTVAAAIARANGTLSRVEQVKRWTILSGDWQPGGDELTPTGKLRRRAIEAKYATAIEDLYA